MYNAETGVNLRIIDNMDVLVIMLILLEHVNVSLLVHWFFIIQLTELLQQLCQVGCGQAGTRGRAVTTKTLIT